MGIKGSDHRRNLPPHQASAVQAKRKRQAGMTEEDILRRREDDGGSDDDDDEPVTWLEYEASEASHLNESGLVSIERSESTVAGVSSSNDTGGRQRMKKLRSRPIDKRRQREVKRDDPSATFAAAATALDLGQPAERPVSPSRAQQQPQAAEAWQKYRSED